MRSRGSPLGRLLGLETEYAIRFSTHRSPGNDVVFQALRAAIGRLVATRPGASALGRDQIFTQNGGAFYYEFLPHCMEGGLIEGATPECRGPGQLLLYQQAQEEFGKEATYFEYVPKKKELEEVSQKRMMSALKPFIANAGSK